MTEKTFFTGFGGQGIVSLGQIWAFCAMKEGKKVTFFPFYGAEKRGGIARANVIISDTEIASPVIAHADTVVVMNQDSLEAAEQTIKTGGRMLVNTTLVTSLNKAALYTVIPIPATECARSLGNEKTANMVMFGALAVLTGAFPLDSVESYLKEFLPEEKQRIIPDNMKAIATGIKTQLLL
jgi:2-oxoglutarate ferredoxin oxidoreductase subunit gamma